MATLGSRLKRARERKRLSQIDVYKKTGINNKTLSRYENDGSEPDIETLKVMAELYDVSIDWLSGNDGSILNETKAKYSTDPKLKLLIEEIEDLSDDDAEYILGLIKRIKKK